MGTISDENAFPEDTFRILVATDNHIGYMERDAIRGQDSINTFREILQLAVKLDVDFVLLAGDLFHENRPSRDTLYQVMALLREYCMNDRPVQIELLSDPEDGKPPGFSFPAINYEDPNLNIGMPVFSIHGNHDDPQGVGPEGALAALDIVSVSGLVNYIGKVDLSSNPNNTDDSGIIIKPVLLRKGNSRLGLYGVGNIKDTRMHFELRSNRVKMYMPKDKDSWFNILLLHQNRVPHGPQQAVPEGMFDDSIDFVIWGHEHDCRIEPEAVGGKEYRICQPGSSVATSLSEGESLEKHVALMEIHGKEYRLTPIPLRTVRPFVMDNLPLEDVAAQEGVDINDRAATTKIMKSAVEALIERANEIWDKRNEQARELGEPELPHMLPLIRLKVDTTGVRETINPIRLSQEFQGRVANPRDVFVFHRAKQQRQAQVLAEKPDLSIDDPDLTTQEKLHKVRMHTLVQEYLEAQQVQVLAEPGMSDALEMYINKDDIHSFESHYRTTLKNMQKGVQVDVPEEEIPEEDLEELVEKAKERLEKEYVKMTTGSTAGAKSKGKARQKDDSDDSMLEDMDIPARPPPDSDEEEPAPKKTAARGKKAAPAKKAPAKKAPAKRGKKAVSSDEDEDDFEQDDEEEEEKPKKRAPAKKAPAKKASASSTKQSTLSFAPSQRAPRAAAAKGRKKTAEVVEFDDSDD